MTENTADWQFAVLETLVREHRIYRDSSKLGDRSYQRLMKKLARRRSVEAQQLVSSLIAIHDPAIIQAVVRRGAASALDNPVRVPSTSTS